MLDDELRRLVDQYRTLAATVPATEFCQRVLNNGVGPLRAAVLLRDLYGMNLLECKKEICMATDLQQNSDSNANS